jgi:drug/metabolite transporter (DMT)-like permease
VKAKHWFVFILLGAIWSSSFMWIKIAVQEIGPITLVAFRVLFGLLFGVAVIFIRKVQLPRSPKDWTPLLVLGITNVAVPFFLISWGEQEIDSAVAAILDATVPLFTILIAHYLLHDDKMTVPKVLGLLLGFAGVIILMSEDIGDSLGSVLGQLAVVLASAFYAGSAVYARKTTEATPGILRSAGPLVSATVVMWLATFLVESPLEVPQLGITWIALLFLGILGSGVAFIMAYYLIHEIGLSWQLLAGAILIILSLAVANMQPKKQERTVEEQVAAD